MVKLGVVDDLGVFSAEGDRHTSVPITYSLHWAMSIWAVFMSAWCQGLGSDVLG